MNTDYSKSLGDLGPESKERLSQKMDDKYNEQIRTSQVLKQAPLRNSCLLCETSLRGEEFTHRGIPFVRCGHCHHVQSRRLPPPNYPYHEESSSFHRVYPELDKEAYQNRIDRIYKPKLDWAHKVLEQQFSRQELQSKQWVELGSGAGYFLSCLASQGYTKVNGYEMDTDLIARADQMTPDYINIYEGVDQLYDTVAKTKADVYVAFFVLEHVLEPGKFYKELSKLPSNSIFIFSVPLFGISCLLEGVFDHMYARNLDTVLHTQLYTEKSIKYALDLADYDIVGQWVFGQDAEDFSRFILASLKDKYSDQLFEEAASTLLNLQDPLQHLFDVNHLSDQRHIIAIKR